MIVLIYTLKLIWEIKSLKNVISVMYVKIQKIKLLQYHYNNRNN